MNKPLISYILLHCAFLCCNSLTAQTTGCDGEFISAGFYESLCEHPDGGMIDLIGSASDKVIGFVWSDANGEISRDNLQVEDYFLTETTTITLSGIVISDNQIINGDFGTGDDFENGFPSNYQGEFYTDFVLGPLQDIPPPPPDPDNNVPDKGDAGYVSPLGEDGSYMITDDSYNGGYGFTDCLEPSGQGGNMAVYNLGAERNKIICTKVQLTAGNEYTFSVQVATVGEVTYQDFGGDPTAGPPDPETLDPMGDADGDGFPNAQDCCPFVAGTSATDCSGCEFMGEADSDGDGIPDDRDNCPYVANASQDPTACSTDDRDGDGVLDFQDNCPEVANGGQEDRDGNGVGDACEEDGGTGGGGVPGGGFGDYCIPYLELELQGVNNQNTVIGDRHVSELEFCVWTDMVRTFTADVSGEVELCLMTTCPFAGGNLLAIDNLQFSETCRFSNDVTIHVDNISANILPVEPLDCNTEGVLLEGEWDAVYEDANSIQFFWFEETQGTLIPGATNEDYYVEETGTYNFSVLNEESGCFAVGTLPVEDNFSNPEAVIELPDTISCANEIIVLDATASSGGADDSSYTYEWNGVFGAEFLNGDPEDNSPTQEVISGGTYELLITNTFNGCTSETFVFVAESIQAIDLSSPQTAYELGCDVRQVEFDVNTNIEEPADENAPADVIEYVWTYNGDILTTSNEYESIDANQSGDYMLVATNLTSGCFDEITFNVSGEAAGPVIAVAEVTESISCDNPDVDLSASIMNSSGITYAWTNSAGNIISTNGELNLSVSTADTYTFTATDDASGCESSEEVIVEGNSEEPDFSIEIPAAFDCKTSNIDLTGIPSDPNGNYTYQWTNAMNQIIGSELMLPVTSAGQYTLQITNADNGCPRSVSINVFDVSAEPDATLAQSQPLNCINNATDITLNSSDDNLIFNWSTGDGSIAAENGNVISVNAGGTYMVTVTDNDTGCEVVTSITAESNFTPPTVQSGTPSQITCENAISSVFIDDFGSNYNYQWISTSGGNITSGANTNSPSFDVAGDYLLTVTNPVSGCSQELPFTVEGNSLEPVLAISGGGQLDCEDENLPVTIDLLNAVPNTSISWFSNNGGTFNGQSNELTALASTAGTYEVIVTNDDNGCTAEAQIEVTQDNDRPTIVLPQPANLDCINQSISLDASGSANPSGVQILWTAANGSAISDNTSLNPQVSNPDTYTLTITNLDNGCSATATVTIEENDQLPTVDIPAQSALSCDAPTLTINGGTSSTGSDFEYQWFDENMNPIVGATNLMFEIAEAGNYTLEITNTTTGCSDMNSISVSGDANLPEVDAGASVQLDCNQDSDFLAGSAPANATYLWTSEDGTIVAGANTLTPEINAAGTYTLTVNVPSTGCEASASVIVEQDTDAPIIEFNTPEILNCNNNTIEIDASGSTTNNVNIQWLSTDNNPIDNSNTLVPEITFAGEYTLILTNNNSGCSTMETITIEENSTEPEVSLIEEVELDCLEPNTTIGAASNPDYEYEWSVENGTIQGANNNAEIDVNEAGLYTLLVTDPLNGCQSEYSVNVEADFVATEIISLESNMLDCANQTVIPSLSLDGDISEVSLIWSTTDGTIDAGMNTAEPVLSGAGIYEVEVTNLTSGCITSQAVEIMENLDAPELDLAANAELTCGDNTLLVGINPADQISTYDYTWTNLQGEVINSNSQLDIDVPGIYTLEILNTENGCTSIDEIEVTENINAPEIEAGDDLEFKCGDDVLLLNGTIISNVTNFEINWLTNNGNIETGENTLQPTISQPGTYTLELTNLDNQCVATAIVEVTPDMDAPVAIIDPTENLNCNTSNLILNGENSTANSANLNFTWFKDGVILTEGVQQVDINSAGIYDLTVLDIDNNCSTTTSTVIEQNTDLPEISILPASNLDCDIREVTLEADFDNSNLTFAWTTVDGNIAQNADSSSPLINAPGAYLLTVQDAESGCINTASIEIDQDGDVPIFSLSNTGMLGCEITETNIDADIPVGSFNLVWTDLSNNAVIPNATNTLAVTEPGSYQLELTNQDNLCSSIQTIEIEQNLLTPELDAIQPLGISCDNEGTTINAQIINGVPNYSIDWTTVSGEIASTNLNTFDLDVLSGGTYTIEVTNLDNGCVNSLNIDVPENGNIPTFQFEDISMLTCLNMELEISATLDVPTTNQIFTWTSADGNIIGDNESQSIIVDEAGEYTLVVEDTDSGCTDEQSITVEMDADNPNISMDSPQMLNCTVLETDLIANVDNANNIDIMWSSANGNFTSPTNNLITTVDQSGDYVLTILNQDNGCLSEFEVTVEQNTQQPTVEVETPAELTCKTERVELVGTGQGIGNIEVLWSDTNAGIIGSNLQEIVEVNLPGAYTFTITDLENNCTNSAVVNVIQNQNVPTDIEAQVTEPLCFGDLGSIDIIDVEGGTGPFTYSIDGSPFDMTFDFDQLTPGTYSLAILDSEECRYEESFTIPEIPQLELDTPADIEILVGQTRELQLSTSIPESQISSISWSPATYLSCDDCLNPTVIPTSDITYLVTIKDANGCSALDSISFRVQRNVDIYTPTAFSPNQDNINDSFTIYAKEGTIESISSLAIYDRWGNEMFLNEDFPANNERFGWNGVFRGELQQPDVFVFKATVILSNGEKEQLNGNFSLIR